jgi:hypothetical protein
MMEIIMQAESVYDIDLFILADQIPDFEKWINPSELRFATAPPQAERGAKRADIIEAWLRIRSLDEGERLATALKIDQRNADQIESIPRINGRLRVWQYPDAVADFGYWGAMPILYRNEGVALLLSKNPRKVTWANVRKDVDTWQFASQFRDLRTVLHRAVRSGQLEHPFQPRKLINWAQRHKLNVPTEFSAAVDAAPSSSASEKLQANPKEKDSLLICLHVLVREVFGHVPNSGRNSTASQLVRLVEKYGRTLDAKTARKYVRQSDELAPPPD